MIFYFYVARDTVFLTMLYAKNESESLSHAQENELKRLAKEIERAEADTQFGRNLIRGAKQILAHVHGEKVLPSYTIPKPPDVKAIRERMGMSQSEFATAFALNRRTLQQSEQGKAKPDGAVSAYLTVIDRNPEAVRSALAHR